LAARPERISTKTKEKTGNRKGKDLGGINASAGNLVGIVNDKLVAEIHLFKPGETNEVGTIAAGKSPAVAAVGQDGRARIGIPDPSMAPGYLPAELTSNGKPLLMETSDALAHELGHVAARWGLAAGSNEGVAIAFENDARKVRDPNTATRDSYKSKGDLKTSAHPFRIPFRRWPRWDSKTLFAMSRTWGFAIGFALGLMIFVSANVMSYRQMLRGAVLIDAPTAFGFPFKLYASSGFGGEWILWSGLIADLLFAVCGSALLGLFAGLVFKRYVSR
jgi:hypothetical protein